MYIVGLDPGGTTGWASVDVDRGPWSDWYLEQIGPEEHHKHLEWMLSRDHLGAMTIVCESFEYRRDQRDNVQLISREYIGVVKLFQQKYNVPVVFQTAAFGKAFWKDDKLKGIGLYQPGQKHAMDAMRHVLAYLLKYHRSTPLMSAYIERLKDY